MRISFIYLYIFFSIESITCNDELRKRHYCEEFEVKKSNYLWTLKSPDGTNSYMFGTIHVPFTEVWEQVSSKVKEALRMSSAVIFELDLHNSTTIETLLKCRNLKQGDNVRRFLPEKLYRRIKQYIKSYRQKLFKWSSETSKSAEEAKRRARNLFNNIAGDWERRQPFWLLFLLYQLGENIAETEQVPMLDAFLAHYAHIENKKLIPIETPFEQCNPAKSVSNQQIIFAINYTLSYLEYEQRIFLFNKTFIPKTGIMELIEKYNCGSLEASILGTNTKTFNKRGFTLGFEKDKTAQQIDTMLRNDIMTRRNVRMAQRIINLLSMHSKEQYFIALGAGHFMGNDSILEILNLQGYITEPIGENDTISYLKKQKPLKFTELWVRHIPSWSENMDVTITVVDLSAGCTTLRDIKFSILLTLLLLFLKIRIPS